MNNPHLKHRAKAVRTVIAATGLSVAALALTPGIALAATVGNGSCDADDFCQYKDDGGGDGGATPTPPLADWSGDADISNYTSYTYFNTTTGVNDEMDWIWNRDASDQTVWSDAGYTGTGKCFGSGYNSTNMQGLENQGSSHATLGSC